MTTARPKRPAGPEGPAFPTPPTAPDPGAAPVSSDATAAAAPVDPRAVRVSLALPVEGIDPTTIGPTGPADAATVRIDEVLAAVTLSELGNGRAVLVIGTVDGDGDAPVSTRLFREPSEPAPGRGGVTRHEVVVDGWRIELDVESAYRASLRDRARRDEGGAGGGGPTQVRAIIPGRIVSVSVVPGDAVEANQQLLVVEAMKMQNELRAPRAGVVARVAVGAGETIEIGDLLVELE